MYRDKYDDLIKYFCNLNGLDWKIIKKQIEIESSFDMYAKSPAGAMGLMQFMPATWEEWGENSPFNPEESIKAGCKYMSWLLSKFKEIPDKTERYKFALASYNAGRAHINEMLGLARIDCNLPESFREWKNTGAKDGVWQYWEIASQNLEIITGEKSKETIDYINKIYKGA